MSTALVPVEQMTAVEIFKHGSIDAILERIEREAREEAAKLDISTETSRKAVASLAYKVARSKTYIDDQGKSLGDDLRGQLEAINSGRKRFRERLDSLKDEVRKPLTDWENAEKARVACHEEALHILRNLSGIPQPFGSADVREAIEKVNNLFEQRDWQEFSKRAGDTRGAVLFELNSMQLRAEQAEAEAIEKERQRAEAAERVIKEREQAAAKAAKEKAEREAAALAEYQAKKADAERERLENERLQAEARAKQAEARAEAEKQAADRRAKEAAEKAQRDQEAAIERERQRVAAEAEHERLEAEKRERNKKHKAKINREAAAALEKNCVLEAGIAQLIVIAIAKGLIPNVTVSY